jgi:hypothetical protein
MTTSYGQEYVRTALAILLGGAAFPTIQGAIGGKLELDGYNADLKLAFEFQGEHHYLPGVFAHHGCVLEDVQRTDQIKVQKCEAAGIRLIIIPIDQFRRERRRICQFLVNEMDRFGMDPLELRSTGKCKGIGLEAPLRPQWQKEIAIESRHALFRHGIQSILRKHPNKIPLPEFVENLLKKRIRPRWSKTPEAIREIEFAWNGSAESSWTIGRKIGFGWPILSERGVVFSPHDPSHQSVFQEFALSKPRLVQG